MTLTDTRGERRGATRLAVVDADIHPAPASPATLGKYVSAAWRTHHETYGSHSYSGAYYPRANLNAARTDAWPPSGLPPGADLDFLREQLLDAWGIEYGVLNPLLGRAELNLDYAAAFARAVNDWQISEWLEPEPRLRGSLIVPYEDGDLAVEEIDRLGDHPGFVQILLPARTAEPLGRRKYWKMYEAALRHDKPIAMHFGGAGGGAITGVGWPSFYVEDHSGMPTSFETQVASLVFEGVFDRVPGLRFVLIEGGFAWLPPLMWRMDRAWRRMGTEVPHVTRPPSEVVRSSFWLTTQPMEEPTRPSDFPRLLAHLGMDDRIMFATDYPHWDFDAPDRALPVRLDPELEAKIMADNARRLYRLE